MFSWGELFSTFMVRKIMGMKSFCRSANRGGPSFIPALCPLSLLPLYLSSIQKATNLNIFWYGLVFCRDIWRLRREKTKQIFSFGVVLCSVSAFFVLLLALLSYWYGWLCCVLRPPSGQKQTKTCYFQINPYLVMCFLGNLRYQKRQKQRINLPSISIFAALSVIIRVLQYAPDLNICSWYISAVVLLCGFVRVNS